MKTISIEKARIIASYWHSGQWSALYSFASSGKIVPGMDYISELPKEDEIRTKKDAREVGQLRNFFKKVLK